MIIIERIYWLVNWAIIGLIAGIIVLLVLRLIANQADLNPFSWSARTIRRLTDPLIGPVRRFLGSFGVDPKFAPLVAILLTVLLGYIGLQLITGIANTIAGVVLSLNERALTATLGYVLYGLLSFYSFLIFLRIIFSWGMVSYTNRFMRFLFNVTEPLLAPLRRLVPRVGAFDISPIVAFLIVWVFQLAIAGTLLRGMRVVFFA
jgi:YggT family protein